MKGSDLSRIIGSSVLLIISFMMIFRSSNVGKAVSALISKGYNSHPSSRIGKMYGWEVRDFTVRPFFIIVFGSIFFVMAMYGFWQSF